MIKAFKENTTRDSGVVYKSTFEQIKKLYQKDKELAGELAIAAIELVLTGEISSDDYMIEIILEDMKEINTKNAAKFEKKVEANRQRKIADQQLDVIAELYVLGLTQKEIAAQIGTTQQTVSNRLTTIKMDYPELLQEIQEKQTIQDYDNDNDNDNDNYNDNDNDNGLMNLCVKAAQTHLEVASGMSPEDEFRKNY
jgi:DNA-binding Lrp family transcriptional regulator